MFMALLSVKIAILPEGSVRDEGVLFILLIILFALIAVAVYMRKKNR